MRESMGSIIRRLRKERGLTQEELAEILGVTFQAVSKWENETGLPDISQVVPLANVFGVTTDTIFGTNNSDTNENIDAFIYSIENKICNRHNADDIECFIRCVDEISRKTKECPSNFRLLVYYMGFLYTLISKFDVKGKNDEAKSYISEFIRIGNVVLNHCTNSEHLNEANMWFTYFYLDIGDATKAEEHARRIATYANGDSVLAHVKARQNDNKEAMRLTAQVISRSFDNLMYELYSLGCSYDRMGKYEEAYQCYALFPNLYELIMKDREDDIPFYEMPSYGQLAMVCMKMGRQDEAMDQLERYLQHEKRIARTYNIVTESKIPYFYGRSLKYSHNHYTARGDISEVMRKKIFDSIRDTDRFRALEKEVLEFEEKYRD
ncbi:MAG: helix-turn-helix domain-containing protein [Oscillospiraceae bacterium]|nr:helix-turn-helix domain-containing protein [Oscillospiraceae bacterium]